MSLHDQPDHLPKLRWPRASDRLLISFIGGMWRVMIREHDVALQRSTRGRRPMTARFFPNRFEAYSYARRQVALWRRQNPREAQAFASAQRAALRRQEGQR
ncbi:hypothetical protein GRS96_12520 [Rathayibacter sp. VKM Ac-2803]|uniref:hypothetical protein n=1 Tax=Rathayibacter sp. VKM Ac-2803 TaxID=2609256 RepID=UPI00135742D4|nr:hypothetical protein [Rathayibacter sp. VKM Ac-2803]MWV50093.1 hypothetical protein [Rathayibacter sp. VKM Ac-2803]